VIRVLPDVGDESAAYLLGAVTANVTIGLLLAAGGRALAVKMKSVSGPVWVPSVLYLAAGVILAITALSAASRNADDDESVSAEKKRMAACKTPAEEVLDRPPANGYAVKPLPPGEEKQALAPFGDQSEGKLEIRQATRRGERVAIVYGVPGGAPGDFALGMVEGAERRDEDASRSTIPLADQVAEYVEFEVQGEPLVAIAGKSDCIGFAVMGPEKRAVKAVAERIAAED
jgi:hypothetical protein